MLGRRRLLQRCLGHLRERGKVGVLLHGLGGNGKSTVAARLLDRLPGYTPAVVYRRLDEASLLRSLARQATDKAGQPILDADAPLEQRLTDFLRYHLQRGQRFCLVLDDFEANLELLPNGQPAFKAKAAASASAALSPPEVLTALMRSLRATAEHRLIITSRYEFTLPELDSYVARASVPALSGADWTKKCDRLDAFKPQSEVDQEPAAAGQRHRQRRPPAAGMAGRRVAGP